MDMSTAIVFFSRDGNTREAARIAAEKTGGFLVEIREKPKRKGPFGFLGGAMAALRQKGTCLIGNPELSILNADTVILGTPVWARNGTPAINEFLNRADLSGKSCHIFCVQADTQIEGSHPVLDGLASRVREKGGQVAGCFVLRGGAPGKSPAVDQIREGIALRGTF